MLILGVDPSSQRTGYALMRSATDIVQAGYLRPHRTTDPAVERIIAMTADLVRLVKEEKPLACVIEITSGKTARRLERRASGLPVYGMAVGAMFWALLGVMDGRVVPIEENLWTGSVPKINRQRLIAAEHPEYRDKMRLDHGGDISDAIGLVKWWFVNRRQLNGSIREVWICASREQAVAG